MLRVASFVSFFLLGVGVPHVWAQSTFEPTDFNVTEALLDNGVNVSAIPALEGLVTRSSPSACSIAVSLSHQFKPSPILSYSKC